MKKSLHATQKKAMWRVSIITAAICLLLSVNAIAQVPAFPSAQGGGAASVGGRGGVVLKVTNLNNSGAGSLRAAMEASGPRTVVFTVGGTIILNSGITVTNPYLTVAGQTAPGGGILLRADGTTTQDLIIIKTTDVVIRYLRVRHGNSPEWGKGGNLSVGVSTNALRRIVFDHVSASWNQDEGIAMWGEDIKDITISWSITAEGLLGHSTGSNIGGGAGSDYTTDVDYHHNLFMNNSHRNALVKINRSRFVNNVVYNQGLYCYEACGISNNDLIGNKFKKGPLYGRGYDANRYPYNTLQFHEMRISDVRAFGPSGPPSIYLSGNIGWNQTNPAGDQWLLANTIDQSVDGQNGPDNGPIPANWKRTTALANTTYPIVAEPVSGLESNLFATVGASRRLAADGTWVANRDAVDTRLVNQYQTDTGISVIPTTPNDVGGFPVIANGTPYADTDNDGMADVWETAQFGNLNQTNNGIAANGHTNLENFLEGSEPTSVPSITTTTLPGGTQSVAYSQTLAATGGDGALVWSLDSGALPTGLSLSGAGVISGAPGAAGTFNFTVRVADSDGVTGPTDEDTQALSIVISSGGSGSLSGSFTTVATAASLTTEGPSDWVHYWSTVNRKASGGSQISNYTVVGGGTGIYYANDPRPLSWTDGTPTASSTSTNGVYIAGQNKGFSVTVPADTTTRTVSFYVGGYNSTGRLTAHLSDSSAADYVQSSAGGAGQYDRNYTLTYSAASAGQTLSLTWVNTLTTGNVTLNGVALDGGGKSVPSITTTTLSGGTQGVAYSQTLAATDGDGALEWSLDSGTLPTGLSLSGAGVISGTPGAVGTFDFTVRVADSDGVTGPTDEDTQALSIVITSDLRAHWQFDETSGTTAADASGNGNTGTLANGPTWVAGQMGNAVNFDGVDDVVNAGSGATLDDLPTLTAMAWIKANSIGESAGRIFAKASGTAPTAGWHLVMQGTNSLGFAAQHATTTLARVSAANAIPLGSWHHVAVTWNGSTTATNVKLYVDGVETGYVTTTNGAGARASDAAVNAFVGNNDTGARTFDGAIDDVRVYSRVLTASEIHDVYQGGANSVPGITTTTLPGGTQGVAYSQTLAATGGNGALVWSLDSGSLPTGLSLSGAGVISGTPGASGTFNFTVRVADSDGVTGPTDEDTQALSIVVADPNLRAHWQFDETSGTTAADASGNGNTGTLANGPTWVAGHFGNAVNFDGVDDVVNAGSGATLDDLPALTATAWIKANSTGEGGGGRIFVKASGTAPTIGWQFIVQGTNSIGFAVKHATTTLARVSTANAITLGAWRHVAVTWDGSTTATNVKLYVDGVETGYVTTTNGAGARASDVAVNAFVGNNDTGARTFSGGLDDVRVYNRVLTPSEIQSVYQGTKSASILTTLNDTEKLDNAEKLTVYPNPTNEFLTIELTGISGKQQIQIFNSIGSLVKVVELTGYSQVDISGLPNGIYFVHLKNNSLKTQKFIKQ